jgi:hypothetical protein
MNVWSRPLLAAAISEMVGDGSAPPQVRIEPMAVIAISRCARMQREKRRKNTVFDAARRRVKRPIDHGAAMFCAASFKSR